LPATPANAGRRIGSTLRSPHHSYQPPRSVIGWRRSPAASKEA
jgi:hypothetical protein